ncbi:AAA family ATPase [Radiobacillus kanasensis]|uniref:AAA family ATPase n=1 Tax=Radiobacillus kanasensis TaxID=2844358 RepID=UPI001E46A888|nr:AAA family ATPase [Radiobacillus kanasensis]UFT98122.1 AAA family ATPase [Radiobacillus kanasensis]
MIKINKLEIENVKRVKAVKVEPTSNGITIVGGKNNQGKTSVLDAIAWGLGGNKYRPSQANREGSVIPPRLHIVLSNGLVVERKGKNSDLKVIDPNGEKAGQQLLDSFVEELAINLPKFMNSTSKEKANILLQIIGVGDKLHELEQQEQEVYNHRRSIGQIADQKKKYAEEQTYYPDAPKEPVSASDLISQQQEILARNGENQRKRQQLAGIQSQYAAKGQEIERLKEQLRLAEEEYGQLGSDLEIAQKDALDLKDESTEELQANIQQIDEINRKVRANLDKDKAESDANDYRTQYDKLSNQIESIRKEKTDLLTNANLPLEGLSVEDGDLVYNGQKWDNMSGSDQLKVSTAIVRKLKPDCGFILLDKLEQMDLESLEEFGKWLVQEDLQAIATRVSSGEECSIIIEDGYVVGQDKIQEQVQKAPETKTWKAGEF